MNTLIEHIIRELNEMQSILYINEFNREANAIKSFTDIIKKNRIDDLKNKNFNKELTLIIDALTNPKGLSDLYPKKIAHSEWQSQLYNASKHLIKLKKELKLR